MTQPKTVVLQPATKENQPPHLIIEVGGARFPIVRGQPTRLSHQAYEVLANMRATHPFTLVHGV